MHPNIDILSSFNFQWPFKKYRHLDRAVVIAVWILEDFSNSGHLHVFAMREDSIIAQAWKRTRPADTRPAERCMCRKVLNETPKTSARKLRCGPRKRGIMLTSERMPACMPASATLATRKPSLETRKPRHKELLAI